VDGMKRVYHFNGSEYGLQNLERRRLKVATIMELNDPFELLAHNSKDPSIRAALKKFKQDAHDRFGFLCFSRSWKSPVQWGHYADKHKGICIGFDVPAKIAYPIQYCDYRLGFDASRVQTDEEKQHWSLGLLTTKHEHWDYEQEERVITSLDGLTKENGLYFAGFHDVGIAVREVIVGCNSGVTRAQISDALGDLSQGISVFKARPSFGHFEMVRNRNDNLWL